MSEIKDLPTYIMNYINSATQAGNLGIVYRLWTIHDREDGDEVIGVSNVRIVYEDYSYHYSMENEMFEVSNTDEILEKHLPKIKEWMNNYEIRSISPNDSHGTE